ncbi:hypothetical protein N431DRAFT_527196 [Stipitochalara longipes BDJ]|nr:hypothetical protein N431DRAFT_527196 [Stipitochalara longipes BDJ]
MPIVIVITESIAIETGVIFKTADTVEAAKNITYIIFDKTGILIIRRLKLKESNYINNLIMDVKLILLGLVSRIKYPIFQAIIEYL